MDDSGLEDTGRYREELYEIFADRSVATETAIQRALELGCDCLGLDIGFLTRITEGTQTVVQSSGDHERLQPGSACPLDRAYCRRTIEREETLSVENAEISPEVTDSAYEWLGLGCYIGAKVMVDGELYGTVCFGDTSRRETGFSERERLFIELLARLCGQGLERREFRQQIEERKTDLDRERRRFRNIVETSFDILFRIDREKRLTYVSPAFEDILGIAPESVIGERFPEFVTEKALPQVLDGFERALDGESVWGMELEATDRDGDRVTFEVNYRPIVEDGTVVGVQGAARDITERKDRTRQLRLRNRAIDAAEIGITITDLKDPERPIVYANDQFEHVTGYEESELLGSNEEFLYGEATDEETIETIREAIETATAVSVEFVAYRKNGSPFWSYTTLTPVESVDGTPSHYIAFHRDVTERKRTSRLLDVLNRVLRHNIRNEVNVITGSAACLEDDLAGDQPSAITRIDRAAENLVDVAERVRELELHTERPHETERLDPERLVTEIARTVESDHPDATIRIDVETTADICAGRDLQQAVEEIVENALVHSDTQPTVEVAAHTDGEQIELTVTDDGPGILPDEAAVIESGRETDLVHNRGMGLWIANWITTKYGGSFQIRPTRSGTVATFRLPALRKEESPEDVDTRPTTLFQ